MQNAVVRRRQRRQLVVQTPGEVYQPIDSRPLSNFIGNVARRKLGPRPVQRWLRIADLVVDTRYQREVGRRGAQNIAKIAASFDWIKFGPVVVAPVAGGRFAIVDGQHRTLAAHAIGIESIPCLIIEADEAAQAAAFAAINSAVTAMTSLQIYVAKQASGDPAAVALEAVCRAAGVQICRYPVPASSMVVGQTLAASQLARLLARYGESVMTLALKCVTKTGDGHPGMVRASIVSALCAVLDGEPSLQRNERRTLAALEDFDFDSALQEATISAKRRRSNQSAAFAALLFSHFDKRLRRVAYSHP